MKFHFSIAAWLVGLAASYTPALSPWENAQMGSVYCETVSTQVGFCDDFSGNTLDTSKWWYAERQWGGNINHGVIPENVIIKNNKAYFAANGDLYSGPLKGVVKSGGEYPRVDLGSRTGGMIVTDEFFGSGRYEVRMRLPQKVGVCSAVWTFHYQEIYEGEPGYEQYVAEGAHIYGNNDLGHWVIINHEIDIETPTAALGQPDEMADYDRARFNTWIGETGSEFTGDFEWINPSTKNKYNDGEFHIFGFDWHSGDPGKGIEPGVNFHIDGEVVWTIKTHVPYIKSRLNIATWFPLWSHPAADFDVQFMEVDWVTFTPFNEANDKFLPETYPNDGLTKLRDNSQDPVMLTLFPNKSPGRKGFLDSWIQWLRGYNLKGQLKGLQN